MRAIGRIIIDAIARRDDPAAQARLAAEVGEIVDRFPVPGPAAGRRVSFAPGAAARTAGDHRRRSLLAALICPRR